MTRSTKQKNISGHNIAADYVGGDKINSLIGKIIGNHNITNINILSSSKYKLTEEDENKFKSFVPEGKIAEFKNLIERIEFLCDLGDYEEAKGFIEEANKIYHNHPILLVLNGLCEYATLDKVEVIKHPELINKTIKLFEKAREVDEGLANYYGWNESIAQHFYEILAKYIEAIRKQVSQYFSVWRHIDYYKAIAKHLIHLENCYKINEETFYLKEFVLHLSGYKGYAWFNITPSGQKRDLGTEIFDGGATNQLNWLVQLIRIHESEYTPPDIQYGNYFDDPQPRNNLNGINRKVKIIRNVALSISTIGIILFLYFGNMQIYVKLLIVFCPILIWGLSHPFGEKMSLLQRFSIFLMKKI